MNLVELNSVGGLIDNEERIVYAQLTNGLPDLDNGIELDEVTMDWWMNLSIEDVRKLQIIEPGTLGMVLGLLTQEVGGDEVHFPQVPQDIVELAVSELNL